MDYTKLEHYAPYIIFVLLFIWQNNIFVRPEALEKKHREILKELDNKLDETEKNFGNKYVELNAYKEFQTHVYSELDKANKGINEIREILINRG